jgi:hypothetical protein
MPLNGLFFTPDELAERLKIEWQFAFVEALESYSLETYALKDKGLIRRYDIELTPSWVKKHRSEC